MFLPHAFARIVKVLVVSSCCFCLSSAPFVEMLKAICLCGRLGAEIGFEDPNLTAAVSENLEKVSKQREISCA